MKTFNKRTAIVVLAAALTGLGTVTGCSVARDQQTVGSYVDDAALTARVKGKLAEDKNVSAMAISVETLNGVVQLSGFAKTSEERAEAERLARATSGVRGVQNGITVRPAGQ